MKKDLAILVGSCDAYEDMWAPFFKLLKRYWKNLKYDIYFSTETKDVKSNLFSVKTIHPSNPKCSWTERMNETLNKINSKYILFILDDFFLYDYVDTKRFDECVELMSKDDDNTCITFYQVYPDGVESDVEGIELRPVDGKYKVNAILSLWDREKFIKHISQADENIWQWELNGNIRCQKLFKKDKFYQIGFNSEKIFPYDFKKYGLFSGKWIKDTVEFFKRNNINVDYSKRGFYEPALAAQNKSIISAFCLDSVIYINNNFCSGKLMFKENNPAKSGKFKYVYNVKNAREVILWSLASLNGFGINNLNIKLSYTDGTDEIVSNKKLFGNYKVKNKLYMFNSPSPRMFITFDSKKKCKKIEISGDLINPLSEELLLESYEEVHTYSHEEEALQNIVYRNFPSIDICCRHIQLDSYVTYKSKKTAIKLLPKKKKYKKLFIQKYNVNDYAKKFEFILSSSTGFLFKNLTCFIQYEDNKISIVRNIKNLPYRMGRKRVAFENMGPYVIENKKRNKKIKKIIIIGKFYSPINYKLLGKIYCYETCFIGRTKRFVKKNLKLA